MRTLILLFVLQTWAEKIFGQGGRPLLPSKNRVIRIIPSTRQARASLRSFKKGWTAELSGFYYAKDYISGVLMAEGRGMFPVGASKKILNGKATVKLNLRDPLYLMSFTAHSDLDKGLTNTHSIWDNRRAVFTLVYRFGKTAGNQIQRKGSGAGDEQSRVGGGNGQQ